MSAPSVRQWNAIGSGTAMALVADEEEYFTSNADAAYAQMVIE